jgi:surface antigen
VKLQYSNNIYHLAFIESVEADGIHISEKNFKYDPDCKRQYRILDFNDLHIIGYWSPII